MTGREYVSAQGFGKDYLDMLEAMVERMKGGWTPPVEQGTHYVGMGEYAFADDTLTSDYSYAYMILHDKSPWEGK